jgi:hypothetical protein
MIPTIGAEDCRKEVLLLLLLVLQVPALLHSDKYLNSAANDHDDHGPRMDLEKQ